MRWCFLACGSGLLFFVTGCGRPYPAPGKYDLSDLAKADLFEVYSLEPPAEALRPEQEVDRPGCFRGYRVLGRVEVPPGAERKELLDALQDGLNRGKHAAHCWEPRHGLRVIRGK